MAEGITTERERERERERVGTRESFTLCRISILEFRVPMYRGFVARCLKQMQLYMCKSHLIQSALV